VGCKNNGLPHFYGFILTSIEHYLPMKHILFIFFFLALFLSRSGAQTKSPRINHIAFSVLDLKRSTDFYTKIIHLDTIPEPFHDGRHTWLSIGDATHLHLIQNPGPIITPPKNTHLCFTTASVDEFIKVLKHNNIAFEDWQGKPNAITIRVDGVKQIYFKDPDGYWIEINDAKD
jgi:lactoylglutathione lyase